MQPAQSSSQVSRLYRELGPPVYRRCLRLLGDRAAAEDATQEVFVKLLRDIDRLSDRDTVLPWIYQVATNHCLNLRRNARRHGEVAAVDELVSMREARDRGPEGYPDLQLVRAVLSRFDSLTQAVAVGVFVDGREHAEVARMVGISRRSVIRKLKTFVERSRVFLTRG
jgi:RNA polymerase sigma-70 factor, ECF subfamily